MSFTELLEQIPALSVQQRREILQRIMELDAGDWLDLDDPLIEAAKKLSRSGWLSMMPIRQPPFPGSSSGSAWAGSTNSDLFHSGSS